MSFTLYINALNALLHPKQIDKLLGALDIDTVEDEFIETVTALGDAVGDVEASYRKDLDALQRYEAVKPKISSLSNYIGSLRNTIPAAGVANIEDLFVLESWRGVIGESARINYNQSDFDLHGRAHTVKREAASGSRVAERLILGEWKDITFKLPRTYKEALRRTKAFNTAGRTRQLNSGDSPSGEGRVTPNSLKRPKRTIQNNDPSHWDMD